MVYAGNQYNQQANPTPINYSTTATGIRFTASNLPKLSDGSKASWYRICYYLRLNDGVDLDQLAADNGGEYVIKNTAKWNGHEGEIDYKVVYNPLDKELVQAADPKT